MKNPLLIILVLLLLSSCNVVVTTPEQPQLSVAAPALPGRWHNVKEDGTPSTDEYLEIFPVDEQNHYNVIVYERGEEDGAYQISLCPTEKSDSYWGFARDQELSSGFRLFHLELGKQEAKLRWLDKKKTEALMGSAGLPFESEQDTKTTKFSTLKIHSAWSQLLEALNTGGVDVLVAEMTRFRRGLASGRNGVDPRGVIGVQARPLTRNPVEKNPT